MPRFVPIEERFKGRHVNQEIVVLCVRWYLSFRLSFRDWVARMLNGQRHGSHDHSEVSTALHSGVRKAREAIRSPGRRILADGGDLYPGQGRWAYLYRAVDQSGKTVDFYLSRERDVNAAKAFRRKAMKAERIPAKITLDAYAASQPAVADRKENGELPKRVRTTNT